MASAIRTKGRWRASSRGLTVVVTIAALSGIGLAAYNLHISGEHAALARNAQMQGSAAERIARTMRSALRARSAELAALAAVVSHSEVHQKTANITDPTGSTGLSVARQIARTLGGSFVLVPGRGESVCADGARAIVAPAIDRRLRRWLRTAPTPGAIAVLGAVSTAPGATAPGAAAPGAALLLALPLAPAGTRAAGGAPDADAPVAVATTISLDSLVDAGESEGRAEALPAWIVDQTGMLLWHADHPEMVLRALPRSRTLAAESCGRCHTSFAHVDRMLRERRGTTFYQLRGKPRRQVSFAPVDFRTAHLTVAVSNVEEAITASHRLAWVRAALTVAAILLVLGAGLALSYRSFRRQKEAEAELRHWRQHRELERELEHRAFHDDLTELANRALFLDRLEACLQRLRRAPNKLFAVVLLDLDRFKVVNDSLGHAVGDALLQSVGNRLLKLVRETDTVARLGGDQFAVLLDRAVGHTEALRVARRIGETFRLPHRLMVDGVEHEVFATASAGIAMGCSSYRGAQEIVRDADTAMHRAQLAGPGEVRVFNEHMHTQAVEAMRLERELCQAIARQEFVLHYQPIVAAREGTVLEVEALIRWNHPTRGLVQPGAFIAAAEESDLIVEIGEWVLREACAQVARWRARGLTEVRVAVNVSGRQLARTQLADLVERVLRETGAPASALTLELTEHSVMEQSEETLTTLRRIADLGVRIALDDFGTGHSSLYRLQELPIHTLKIDRSFVQEVTTSRADRAITAAVVEMAHSLGLIVVAEGVETPGQQLALCELGCDLLQGYLFLRPVPPEDLPWSRPPLLAPVSA